MMEIQKIKCNLTIKINGTFEKKFQLALAPDWLNELAGLALIG